MRPFLNFLAITLFMLALITPAAGENSKIGNKPNVWNFQIARKVIAAFQFKGMGMSIWEDQGVENTTIVSRRQFYVTPLTEFLPNSTMCAYNALTGANSVSYDIQLWNDHIQLSAMDRLKQMQINVAPEQVQPLPFYQVRVIWNNAEEKLQKARLSTTWENNLQQQSIRRFKILTDDKATCDLLATTLQSSPELFTSSIALQYSLSASTTATRILTVKTEHFLNSRMMAALKSMDTRTPERYLTSNDSNRLSMEIMNNVVASQAVDGDYVPDTEMLSLKDIIISSLQLVNADVGNFTTKVWESVFWDPVYARPDKVTSYLNKVLKIDQGKHSVSKSSAYSEKDENGANFGIGKLFSIGGTSGHESSNSASFADLQEWLRQNNYDVEVQGELFIPKSLQLKRLNLGVLNRQETIYSKSVQMHHIDAPGTLTVTVGSKNKSVGESEDLKNFRARLDNLEPRVDRLEPKALALEGRFGQSEPKITALEVRLSRLEPKIANAAAKDAQLSAAIENVRVSLTKSLGKKISACQICIKPYPNPNDGRGPLMCSPSSKTPGFVSSMPYCRGEGCGYSIRCAP